MIRNIISRTSRLLLLVALVVPIGCRKKDDAKKEAAATPVPVRVALAETRKLRPSFEVIGTVLADPERIATLTAPTSGLVDKLVVSEGAKVAKGAVVVQLDERAARNALERAEAAYERLIAKPRPEEVTQARAAVAKAQAAHALAVAKLKKTQDLKTRSPELVPDVQLLDDQRTELTARAEVDTAQAQLALLERGPREEQRREARAEVESAKLQLTFCRVTTPFAGEVIELKARVGQRADVGIPLATVLDSSNVVVQARLPGNRLGLVAAALQHGVRPLAQVRSPSFADTVYSTDVGWLGQQTEAGTGDIPVRLRIVNANGLLRAGMTVQVQLFGPATEGVAIPEKALTVNEDGKHIVTVIRENKAFPTEIELAPEGGAAVRVDGWVLVFKGLKAGDAVAVENGYGLPEGTPVTPSLASSGR